MKLLMLLNAIIDPHVQGRIKHLS